MSPGPPETSNVPQNTAFPPCDPRSDPTFESPKPPEPDVTSALPSLTNDIHPLFSRDKFPANVDYDWVFLEPAKLASQILSTLQATHWLLALFTNCKHKSTCEGNESSGHPYRSSVNIHDLQDHHKAFVQHWLHKIAERRRVIFKVGGDGLDDRGQSEAEAWTWTFTRLDGPDSEFSLGKSEIHIGGKLYCELLLGKTLKAEEVLRKRFYMASILLHELGHALWYAVTEREGDEDIFEDETTAEAGVSFETHLFGLVPYDDASELEWQSPCGIRYARFSASGGPDYVESLYTKRYVESLFTDHFWESNFLCGGDLGIVAWCVRERAHYGGTKPHGVPTSIWELCKNSQSMKERFIKQMSCHFAQLTPRREDCIPSVSDSTTVEKKEPKVITTLPKFRGIVPYISPAVLSSIRSMSDNDLTELLNDVGKWHIVGGDLDWRGSQVLPQTLALRPKESPEAPQA